MERSLRGIHQTYSEERLKRFALLMVGAKFKNSLGICLAVGVISSAAGIFAQEPPPLTAQRYTEDYSYLSDPEKRSGAWWEIFKWIPIDPGGHIRLNVGEDLLTDVQLHRNNPFASGGEFTDQSYFLFRTSPYADLHLGSQWRMFGQFVGAWTTRPSAFKSPAEETGADFLQAFAEWRAPLGSEGSPQNSLTFRAGRQVLAYGSQRLIAPGRFVRRSFDGGVVQLKLGDWRTDAFFMWPVSVGLSSFDDKADRDRGLWSLYTTRMFSGQAGGPGLKSGIDFYYIGFKNDMALYSTASGKEIRHTLGARFFGEASPWRWDTEALFQFGHLSDSDIRAWAVASAIAYDWFQLRANVLSGDRDNGAFGTFNAMFPAIRYFGYLNLIGPANLISLRPIATFQLAEDWTLSPSAVFYWRESLTDGVYGPGLNPVASPDTLNGRYTGTQGELSLEWAATRNLAFLVVYSAYWPHPGPTTQLFLLETNFQF